jgi:hypothetical protein
MTKEPVHILPNVSFKQVVCSESVDITTEGQNQLALFGVSTHDELYYVRGVRKYKGNQPPVFSCSGIPIRTGVEHISSQYNAQKDSSEVLYTGNGINEVFHLSRDPKSSCWTG